MPAFGVSSAGGPGAAGFDRRYPKCSTSPPEHRMTASNSGIACGRSQAQNSGQARSREKIQTNAPSVRPL
jgi:hypothetical protein